MKHILLQLLIALNQFVNIFLSLFFPNAWKNAWADETLSCRSYRAWRAGKPLGRFWMPVIDFIFKRQKIRPAAIGHCHNAYLSERERYNAPPELREPA